VEVVNEAVDLAEGDGGARIRCLQEFKGLSFADISFFWFSFPPEACRRGEDKHYIPLAISSPQVSPNSHADPF
jgi:hypothetical protein